MAGIGSNLNDSIDSIVEFGPTASGTATPIRTLSGAATQIAAFETVSLAVDTAGNLYFAEDDSATFNILVFGPTAQGNDAPSAYITSGLFTSFVQLAVH